LRSLRRTICSCTVPHDRPLDLRIIRHYLLSSLGGGSGHGALIPSPQILDNASRYPPPITIPLHHLTATIHDPFPRVCCTLLLLSVPPLFPVSNDASYSSVLWRQGPRHTCSLARPDGWGAKGDESDGERGESRVISIQRPLYSGAALRSNAIKGPLYHTFLTVAWLVLPSRAG